MKTNGKYSVGGTIIGNDTNYAALAAIEASFVGLLTVVLWNSDLRHKHSE